MASAFDDDQVEVDSEAALDQGILRALSELKIISPDREAMAMLRFAARLTPDDKTAAISTSRLFYAAIATSSPESAGGRTAISALGANLPLDLYAGQRGSYAETVAQAIIVDPELAENVYGGLARLFQLEAIGAALARLEGGWFSPNTARILTDAATGGTLSGDAIVRSIFSNDQGLIYGRIPMKRVAEATERVKLAATPSTADALTLQDEVNAALAAAISFPVHDRLRARLAQTAAFRLPGAAIDCDDIVATLALTEDPLPGGRGRTDPSTMFLDAAVSLEGPVDPDDVPTVRNLDPDPKNPVRFNEEAISMLRRGHELQRRFFRNRALGAKGVFAAFLTRTAAETGVDIAYRMLRFRARFLAIVQERLADQPAMVQKWVRALELERGPAPKLTNDQPWSGQRVDHLDIANDAGAIANVAAGQNSSLPMAFGVFGDWGAGKTFFMRLIQEQIAALVVTDPPDDGFEHAIVQIQFNAWHYAETNLWASLVGHIFSELDRWMTRGKGETPKKADELLSRLSTSRQLALEAATDLMQRRKSHRKAGAVLATAQDALVSAEEAASRGPIVVWGAAVKAVRQAIQGDDALRNQLASARLALGLPELMEDKAKLAGLLNEVNEAASAGNAALAALRATAASRATIILAIVMLILVPAALFSAKQLLARVLGGGNFTDIGHGFESLGGLLAVASVLVGGFTRQIRTISDKFTALRRRIDDEVRIASETEQEALAAAGKSLGAAAAEVEQARTVLRATGDQVAAALREYAEETAGPRIARFVRARAGDEGYARHLGLVSAIRRDFEQLEALMLTKGDPPDHLEAARLHYKARVDALITEAGDDESLLTSTEKAALRKTAKSLRDPNMPEEMAFRRIVLFIDDLDRCDADKVVEVLQAVNMLLTFRLFVVVVAVDARWLTRSLEKRYPDFFGVTNGGGEAGRATAADYLEKIFQVPYWVPRMTAKASEGLVGDLIAGDRIAHAGPSPTPASPGPEPVTQVPDTVAPTLPVSALTPEDEQPEDEPDDRKPTRMIALGLTTKEIEALTALSPFLGGSPRRAGRFVNLYRVAKASLSPAERQALEVSTYRALATQLAIATGAPNGFDSWVSACATPDAKLEDILTRMGWPSGRNDETVNLLGAVEWFRKDIDPVEALNQLRSQAPRAARFSFVVPMKETAQGGAPANSPTIMTAKKTADAIPTDT